MFDKLFELVSRNNHLYGDEKQIFIQTIFDAKQQYKAEIEDLIDALFVAEATTEPELLKTNMDLRQKLVVYAKENRQLKAEIEVKDMIIEDMWRIIERYKAEIEEEKGYAKITADMFNAAMAENEKLKATLQQSKKALIYCRISACKFAQSVEDVAINNINEHIGGGE